MTDEERQRQMDFLLTQQAQFAANLQQHDEARQQADRRLDRLERVVKLAVRAGLRSRRNMREQDTRITTLVDSQLRTEEIARQNSESIGRLAEIVRQLATGHANGDGQNGHA
jgi:hypothetical protein